MAVRTKNPFLFFNHGTRIDLDRIGKRESLFIWFERAPNAKERAAIAATVPEPVSGSFVWDGALACFGNAGDSYDFDVIAAGAPAESKKLMAIANRDTDDRNFDKLYVAGLKKAAPIYLEAFEAWVREAHERVPVAFVQGPWMVSEPDAWGKQSEAGYPQAIARALEHDGDSEDYAHVLGTLANAAPKLDAATQIAVIERLADLDHNVEPYDKLSSAHVAHVKIGRLVKRLLQATPVARRRAVFAKLSPYARLIALAHEDVIAQSPEEVADLLARVPKSRAAIAASLVMHMATRSASAELMELAARGKHPLPDMFINGSMYWLNAKQPKKALALARRGHEEFPDNGGILRNLVAAANDLEDYATATKYSAVAAKLEGGPPDVARVLNETFALIKSGKLDAALALLHAYMNAGGADDARIWINVLACYSNGAGEPRQIAVDADAIRAKIDHDRALLLDGPLVENMIIVYGMLHRFDPLVSLVNAAFPALLATPVGRKRAPSLAQSLAWGALCSKDELLYRVAVERVEELDGTFDLGGPALDCLAALYAVIGDRAKMFATLERLRRMKYDGLAALEKDKHFASMHRDPEFKAFFAVRR